MKRVCASARRAAAWLARLLCWRRRVPARVLPSASLCYVAELVDEQPDALEPGRCYLVGEGQSHLVAAFVCPCGCGAIVVLNLLEGLRPRWRAVVHEDNTVSFTPSVARHVGCRSHFFVRRGLVEWCARSLAGDRPRQDSE